ncbi:phosphonate C-P lyase system protein PhnH [Seohaeicola zhoushanensis]|uniref:Carbon-phosphorus lyase complex subunit n=1 Tax=Seohaeicola zhoushanensis TaxID=1569283 RepID=A0A8J3M7K1_9RHOB|nr:phosphonate C-P lyase system protein PhnH [Seohaeicola zhoushanensis]GHF48226.1 carbon-phosphorus lyase complex subunit [Seohaeicola zhoushanensis]
MSTHLTGGFDNPPVQSALAFRAVMNALARPGRIETVAGAAAPAPVSPAAAVLLLTLCDAETPIFLAGAHDCAAVRDWLAFHCGTPVVTRRAEAMFALGGWEALAPIGEFSVGAPEYPDRAATLIVEVDELEGAGARLTGPGIAGEARLSLPEVAAFAANHARFPLGFDSFLTCGSRIAGLPRSTRVETD